MNCKKMKEWKEILNCQFNFNIVKKKIVFVITFLHSTLRQLL